LTDISSAQTGAFSQIFLRPTLLSANTTDIYRDNFPQIGHLANETSQERSFQERCFLFEKTVANVHSGVPIELGAAFVSRGKECLS
jgi:hypothetical protein